MVSCFKVSEDADLEASDLLPLKAKSMPVPSRLKAKSVYFQFNYVNFEQIRTLNRKYGKFRAASEHCVPPHTGCHVSATAWQHVAALCEAGEPGRIPLGCFPPNARGSAFCCGPGATLGAAGSSTYWHCWSLWKLNCQPKSKGKFQFWLIWYDKFSKSIRNHLKSPPSEKWRKRCQSTCECEKIPLILGRPY